MPQIIIKKGDNLSTIAKNNGITVQDLLKLNPTISNPNLIREGATLSLPETGATPTIDENARSLPGTERTLDGAGNAPARNLPEPVKSPMLRFSSVMNDAVNLAKQKRQKVMQGMYEGIAPKGKLPASDFANFLTDADRSAQEFTKPLVDTAMDSFRDDEESIQKNKEKIQGIAEKIAENGAPQSVVQDILGQTDVESALIKSSSWLNNKKSSGGGGSSSGDGDSKKKYSPEDERALRAAGLWNNPDDNVKAFFLAMPSNIRNVYTQQQTRDNAYVDMSIDNIAQVYEFLEAEEEKKKKKGSGSSLEDRINAF